MYPPLSGAQRDEDVMMRILGSPQFSVSQIGRPNQPVGMDSTNQAGGVNTMYQDQLAQLYQLLGMLRGGMGR